MPYFFVFPVETPLMRAKTPSDTITTAMSSAKKIATLRSLCGLLFWGMVRSGLSRGLGVMVGDLPSESGRCHDGQWLFV